MEHHLAVPLRRFDDDAICGIHDGRIFADKAGSVNGRNVPLNNTRAWASLEPTGK